MMGFASATHLDGHDYSNFRAAVGKLILMAPWRPNMQFAIQQLPIQILNPTTESKRVVRHFKATQHTCLRLEPRGMVQKVFAGTRWSAGACDSATRQSVTGLPCDIQDVTMRNRSLKQTAISLSSCEAENCWDSQNSSSNFTATFQFVSRWIQTRQDTLHSAGDQADSNTLKYDAWQYNSGYERNVCR